MGMEGLTFTLGGLGGNEKNSVGAFVEALTNAKKDSAAIDYYISQMSEEEKEINKDLIALLNRSRASINGLARIISDIKVG